MTYKQLKHKIILVFRVARIPGSSLSDKLLFNTFMSIDLSPNYFEERKKHIIFFIIKREIILTPYRLKI